jgi:hypothetical protein
MLRRTFATGLVFFGLCGLPAHGQSRPAGDEEGKALNLAAYTELLRSDVRAQKVAILTEVMGLTPAEDSVFWPIYREYEVEMAALGDQRAALIVDYARAYATLTDGAADQLATRALDLEARRQSVKAKYYDRVKRALTPRTAMRFLQVEQHLLLLIDLQIAASLPVAPSDTGR